MSSTQEWQMGNFYGLCNERGAVGRNIPKIVQPQKANPRETTKGQVQTNIICFQESCRSIYEDKYDETIKAIAQFEKQLMRLKKEGDLRQRIYKKLKRTHLFQIMFSGCFGLYFGLITSAGTLLKIHGPTTTILGTIVASLFYIICGIGFAIICGWAGKEVSKKAIVLLDKKVKKCKNEIALTRLGIEELKDTASQLAEKAWA